MSTAISYFLPLNASDSQLLINACQAPEKTFDKGFCLGFFVSYIEQQRVANGAYEIALKTSAQEAFPTAKFNSAVVKEFAQISEEFSVKLLGCVYDKTPEELEKAFVSWANNQDQIDPDPEKAVAMAMQDSFPLSSDCSFIQNQ